MEITLRDYQQVIVSKGVGIVKEHGFVYLAMDMRTGKTLTSLSICSAFEDVNNVLFITKKKAISSITKDHSDLNPSFDMLATNYEALHKLPDAKWDFIIIDEAHSIGAFPKPSKRAIQIKELIERDSPNIILLSGTPTPESFSQMYHQVYGIANNPFSKHKTFYKFAREYVDVRERIINSFRMNDYSRGNDSIIKEMEKYTLSKTQQEAGFMSVVDEEILYVQMKPITMDMCSKLKKDKVLEGRSEVILADTAVKLMMKLHQMYSGTVKFEPAIGSKISKSMVFDDSKAIFIKERFKDIKIGIFYKFKQELKALKEVFGDNLTEDIDEFNATGKNIALQIVSGREGISLSAAKYLVYYNIDFSATSYWQSRSRLTTKDRLKTKLFWIFSVGGIEGKIHSAVIKKKNYTIRHFKKDYQITK